MRWFFTRCFQHAILVALLYLFQCVLFSWSASPRCPHARLRKEIRSLNELEWSAFIGALNQLKRSGRYDVYTQIHIDFTQAAHGGSQFLPWHRRFLYQFETELLQITGKALTGLPYFDPFLSYDVFTPNSPRYLGNGQGCILQGPFNGWRAIDNQCLNRQLNSGANTIDPRVLFVLAGPTFGFFDFAFAYEYGQHADVHGAVGGHMSTLNGAPNDPMFWLHHGHVDYVWYKRQWFDVQRLYWDMGGQHMPTGVTTVTLSTRIPPWNDNVAAIADTYATLCYDYEDPIFSSVFRRDVNNTHHYNFRMISHIPMPSDTMLRNMRLERSGAERAMNLMNHIADELNTKLKHGEDLPAFQLMQKDPREPTLKDAGEGVIIEFSGENAFIESSQAVALRHGSDWKVMNGMKLGFTLLGFAILSWL